MPSHAMNIINLKKGGSPEPPPAYAPDYAQNCASIIGKGLVVTWLLALQAL